MSVSDQTIRHLIFTTWLMDSPPCQSSTSSLPHSFFPPLLMPIRNYLNNLEVVSPALAHRLCQLIPAQCPFARKITFGGRIVLTIPPLCKLNPFYDELMMLRFRALSYLADQLGEDISQYC